MWSLLVRVPSYLCSGLLVCLMLSFSTSSEGNPNRDFRIKTPNSDEKNNPRYYSGTSGFNPAGDICEAEGEEDLTESNDLDADRIPNDVDNCPFTFNPLQTNTDGDRSGDACENSIIYYYGGNSPYYKSYNTIAIIGDGDTDGDFVIDTIDNCLTVFNPLNTDTNFDGIGDACNYQN